MYPARIVLLVLLFALPCGRTWAEVRPQWSSDRAHRLIVRVDPVPTLSRGSDEMVARAHVDFTEHVLQQRADLSSLQVVGIATETGEPVDYEGNPYASTPGDRPTRFYDDSIPWEFPEHEGVAHV